MKLPKKLFICGREWTITTTKKHGGGYFWGHEGKIEIGLRDKKRILEIFLHEIIETIITERSCRYSLYEESENGDYLFSFNHKEFENIIKDITSILKDFIKI